MNPDELPSVGETLGGKYRLTGELGRGGMGAVFEATHLRLARKVAIKVVLPEVARRPELAYRFEHEARVAAKLHGRHTVRVLDVDTTPEGLPYLVMELLEGHSLRDELGRRGPLPAEDAVRYVREACEGVDEAHRAGIIHRDLKPANLFLSVDPEGFVTVKVVDFGIAKAADVVVDAAYQTATDAPLGTYKYMSPEQAKSPRGVDARTDIWSLGVVLYQLLAGRTPFHGEGALGVVFAIATQAPPPLGDERPDLPEGLAAVVERALCKDREGRFQTVRELSDALAPFDLSPSPRPSRPSFLPSMAPGSGPLRYPPPSGPPLTPAMGLTPRPLPADIGSAPTIADGGALPATGDDSATPLAEPPRRAPLPQPLPPPLRLERAPNENDPSVAKSHVVSIKPKKLPVGLLPALPWLVGALVVLAGAVTMGVRAARVGSNVATLASAAVSRAEPPPSAARAAASLLVAPEGARPPPQVTPVDSPAEPAPEAKPKAERGAAGASTLNAPLARPGAKPPSGKARPGKAGGEPVAREAASARPKPSEAKPNADREIFD